MNQAYREITAKDVMIVLAENIRLIFFLPLVIGCVIFTSQIFWSKTYTSQAVMLMPSAVRPLGTNQSGYISEVVLLLPTAQQAASLIMLPVVLDPVVKKTKLSEAVNENIDIARAKLASRINVAVGKEGFLRLSVNGDTPQEAQKLADAIIDSYLSAIIPVGGDLVDLQQRLESSRRTYDDLSHAVNQLRKVVGGRSGLINSEQRQTLVELAKLQSGYQQEVLFLQRLVAGFSRNVVQQPPTLPVLPSYQGRVSATALAAIASFIFAVAYVLIRRFLSELFERFYSWMPKS